MCLDFFNIFRTSLVAQMVKNLLAMQETWVQPLGWEAPLEKEMATYSSILAWRISWAEEPDRLHSKGLQKELDMAQQLTNKQQILYCIFFPKPDLRCCI